VCVEESEAKLQNAKWLKWRELEPIEERRERGERVTLDFFQRELRIDAK